MAERASAALLRDARHFLYARFRHNLPSYHSMYGEDYSYAGWGDHAHREFDDLELTKSLTFGEIADLMEEYHASRK